MLPVMDKSISCTFLLHRSRYWRRRTRRARRCASAAARAATCCPAPWSCRGTTSQTAAPARCGRCSGRQTKQGGLGCWRRVLWQDWCSSRPPPPCQVVAAAGCGCTCSWQPVPLPAACPHPAGCVPSPSLPPPTSTWSLDDCHYWLSNSHEVGIKLALEEATG